MNKVKNKIYLFSNNQIIINNNNTYNIKEKESYFISLPQILNFINILINIFSLLQF